MQAVLLCLKERIRKVLDGCFLPLCSRFMLEEPDGLDTYALKAHSQKGGSDSETS